MTKQELIEKYPDVVKEISVEFLNKFARVRFSQEEVWKEYLEENEPKVIFKTLDDVEIFQKNFNNHDIVYVLHNDNQIVKIILGLTVFNKTLKLFSSYEVAEEYRLKHAKVLSFDDIMIYLPVSGDSEELILDLIKERLDAN